MKELASQTWNLEIQRSRKAQIIFFKKANLANLKCLILGITIKLWREHGNGVEVNKYINWLEQRCQNSSILYG